MIFLDATYSCTFCDLPVFFVAVLTNVGYHIVGSLICENEMASSIAEGLTLLKLNGDNWAPSYVMARAVTITRILAIQT